MRRFFLALVALLALFIVTTQASADTGQPAELYVRIGWTHAGEKPGTENNMVTPHIVVAPDHLIISSTNLFKPAPEPTRSMPPRHHAMQ
jgi:hypothetical protein